MRNFVVVLVETSEKLQIRTYNTTRSIQTYTSVRANNKSDGQMDGSRIKSNFLHFFLAKMHLKDIKELAPPSELTLLFHTTSA